MIDFLNDIEINFLLWLHTITGNSVIDTLMRFISTFGNKGAIFVAAGFILLINKKTRKTGLIVLTALLLNMLVVNLTLKPFVDRIRPYDYAGVVPLISPLSDASFPSGHTSAAFAFLSGVWKCSKPIRISALVFALLMAFSRMYLFVHFPTDVLAGALIGILCGVFADWLWREKGKLSSLYFK